MSTMPLSMSALSPARLRSSFVRIPLASKVLLAVIGLFSVANLVLGVQEWAQLAPDKVGLLAGGHRLSVYPFLHLGLIHTVVNVVALTPLLEKFETENGTLVTALLFTGPFSTFPGVLYTVICNSFGIKTPVRGASIWVFLLLTSTIYRASQSTPFISVSLPSFQSGSTSTISSTSHRIPTVVLPIIFIILTSFLIPHTSLLGHLCGTVIGYGWGTGILKFLAPPEKILRWVEEKGKLRSRLPSSYVSVDRTSQGRFGLGVLPTDEISLNGGSGLTGTGDAGRRA